MITPSLVVVTKDGTDTTMRVFDSAGRYTNGFDHILINNNCCQDHNLEMRKYLPEVRIFEVKNVGLPHCWNMGLLYSVNDWVIISNDDIIFPKNWLEIINNELHKNRFSNPRFFNLAFPGRWGCFLMHKDLIQRVGWFDESFTGIYYEDDDYYQRLQEVGEPIILLDLCQHDRTLRDKDRKRHNTVPDLNIHVGKNRFFEKWKPVPQGQGLLMKSNIDGKRYDAQRIEPEVDWHPYYVHWKKINEC